MALKTSLTSTMGACLMGLGLAACAVGTTGSTADGVGGAGSGSSGSLNGTGTNTTTGQSPTTNTTTGQSPTTNTTQGSTQSGELNLNSTSSSNGSGGGQAQDCDNDAKQIYVISKDGHLRKFEPKYVQSKGAGSFSDLGAINCPSGSTPNSMAVDRNGVAWVDFKDGTLFKVDTGTLACTPTSFQYPQNLGPKFGMGFSSDSQGSSGESLFAVNDGGIELFRIDTNSLAVNSVSRFANPVPGGAVELTGTGAGQLFGLFFDIMSEGSLFTVGEIDKSNASILGGKKDTGIMDMPLSLAFAFWGGSAWIFTGTSETSSQVFQYTPGGASATTVVSRLDFKVVGAGVSTCAPATEAEIANVQ